MFADGSARTDLSPTFGTGKSVVPTSSELKLECSASERLKKHFLLGQELALRLYGLSSLQGWLVYTVVAPIHL